MVLSCLIMLKRWMVDKNFLIFGTITSIVLFLINYFFYKRFILLLELPIFWQNFLSFLLLCIYLLELLFLATFKQNFLGDFYIVLASFIGVSFMLFVVAVVYNLFYLSIDKIEFELTRREAILKLLNIGTIVGLALYLLKGFWGGLKDPEVKSLHVKIKNLKKPLNIVQITDVHIGQFLKKEFLQTIVKKINSLHADIVVITGDLVDLEVENIKDELNPLQDIKSKYGLFFVPGNHEYYHGVDSILAFLQGLHVKILGNKSVEVGGINLAGVYDLAALKLQHPLVPDINEALKDINRSLPTILLAHQPKMIENIKDKHGVDLMLSGHTHGGQIFPFGLLVKLAQPYLYGLYKHSKKTQIYVSSGAGFWGPPIRFLAPCEIALLQLVPQNSDKG